MHQLDLTDTFGTLYPTTVEYTFFPSIHGTLFKIRHMLGHKTNFNKFKTIGIIQSMFSDYNGIKLEINQQERNLENSQVCIIKIKQHTSK